MKYQLADPFPYRSCLQYANGKWLGPKLLLAVANKELPLEDRVTCVEYALEKLSHLIDVTDQCNQLTNREAMDVLNQMYVAPAADVTVMRTVYRHRYAIKPQHGILFWQHNSHQPTVSQLVDLLNDKVKPEAFVHVRPAHLKMYSCIESVEVCSDDSEMLRLLSFEEICAIINGRYSDRLCDEGTPTGYSCVPVGYMSQLFIRTDDKHMPTEFDSASYFDIVAALNTGVPLKGRMGAYPAMLEVATSIKHNGKILSIKDVLTLSNRLYDMSCRKNWRVTGPFPPKSIFGKTEQSFTATYDPPPHIVEIDALEIDKAPTKEEVDPLFTEGEEPEALTSITPVSIGSGYVHVKTVEHENYTVVTQSILAADLTFKQFSKANADRCDDVFHPVDDWSLSEWGNAVGGEVGEAQNIIKKLHRGDFELDDSCEDYDEDGSRVEWVNEMRDALAGELADAVTYIDLLAQRAGIDLETAIKNKFNQISDERKSSIKL